MEKKAVSGIMLTLLLLSMSTLVFNIQLVKASGTIYIRADGLVHPSTAPIQRDGDIYTLTDNIYDEIVVKRDNIVVDGAGYTVQGTGEEYGIYLSYRNNVTVKDVEVTNFKYGIYLYYSNDNSLSGNTFSNNYVGIVLTSSSNNIVTGNNASSNNAVGIAIGQSSNNNVLSGNNASDNYSVGIAIGQSSNNNVLSGNNATSNTDCGISVGYSSNNNVLSGNIASSNFWWGILVSFWCSNTVLSGNIASSNGDAGIIIYCSNDTSISGNMVINNGYGIFVEGCNNSIFHNNLINNIGQVRVYPSGSVNTLDNGYPSGGNYWSDYTGVDLYSGPDQDQLGSDGIGDTSYIIDGNNIDHYPLISPFSQTPDFGIVVSPSTGTTVQGITVKTNVYAYAIAGYDYLVSLSASGQPEGVTIDFNPNTGTPDFASTMTVQVGDSVPPNTYSITVTGLGSDGKTHSTTYMLTVTALEAIYIRADGTVAPPTAPIQRNGNIYTLTDNIYDEIVVKRDNIVVDGAGYTVQGTGEEYGIYLSYRNNVTVKDVEVTNFKYGIYLDHSSNNTLIGNTVTNNEFGILLDHSYSNVLVGNTASNNSLGICLKYSSNNTVSGNNATNNYSGVWLAFSSNNNSVHGNDVTWNAVGIEAYGHANYNTISGNNIINNGVGIWAWSASNYNTISGNNVTNNGFGIGVGFYLMSPTAHNIVSENTITNNNYGMYLYWTGGNTVSGNNIINNECGVEFERASGNTFYHNNFSNKQQVVDLAWGHPEIPPSKCVWDNGYPSGGNYWSDYTGTDTDGDGIGNAWYWIRWGVDYYNRDRYPLMKPYGGAHDIGITGITPSETSVDPGSMLDINITILNYGLYTETFNLTAYSNTTVISQTEVTLSSRTSTTITFTWDTTGVTPGTYTLKVQASTVLGETDTTDNTFEDGAVTIVTPEYLTQKLIEAIKSWNLSAGTENSLTSKLEETIQLLDKGNENGAVHKLMDFMNQVEALRDKGKLEKWQAGYLISEAQRIIDLING